MERDKEQTRVVFRKYKSNGDILALFPDIEENSFYHYCGSYEHTGQHGAADYQGCIELTTPATPDEYSDLKKELELLGYNLKPIKRNVKRRG